MTATVTRLFPEPAPLAPVDLDLADLRLQTQRVDSCRRFLSRRKRRLEISFFDIEGTELRCAPAESGLPEVTAAAIAIPTGDEFGVRDVLVGVTDPIPTASLEAPGATLAAISAAIGDLMVQFLIHPAEVQP